MNCDIFAAFLRLRDLAFITHTKMARLVWGKNCLHYMERCDELSQYEALDPAYCIALFVASFVASARL